MVSGSNSVSTSGGHISFGGLASGIDTNSIINALMDVGRRPITSAQHRRDAVKTKINALGSVNGSLGTLLGTLNALKDPATFSQRTTTVSAQTTDANKVTAVATNSAALRCAASRSAVSPTASRSPRTGAGCMRGTTPTAV